MAESKGSLLAKSVQKHAGRAKEKILQNLGKVDRTADEIFDEHLNNFNSQNGSANKLQKEFSNYIRCVRAAQLASKSLMDAICEVYEPQWSGYDDLVSQSSYSESIWQEFSHKLGDQVLVPLTTYTAQFPEMKKKIEKRNRKLIDYDSQRHSFQNIQANATKRKDDVKLTKGREQLEEARRTYEILNTELHDELPALFDSRILFLVTNLQTLFASEQVFHNETSKIYAELESIVDKLATESQRGSYTIKKSEINPAKTSPVQSPVKTNHTSNDNSSYQNQITNGSSNANSPVVSTSSSPILQIEQLSPKLESKASLKQMEIDETNDIEDNNHAIENEPSYENTPGTKITRSKQKTLDVVVASGDAKTTTVSNSNNVNSVITNNANAVITTDSNKTTNNEKPTATTETLNSPNANSNPDKPNEASEIIKLNEPVKNNGNVENTNTKKPIPGGVTTNDLPPGTLYRVKATYAYEKEDVDELSFEVGDTIRVIEYDDPEDQEEGWLMGEKEGTTEKGLFPANFTRPI